jgi:thiol-disulfide isomerase/thioredoxin
MAIAVIACLAIAAVAAGRQARLALKPRSLLEAEQMLDELERPTRLTNAPLADPSGATATLFERIHQRRAAIAFYAPWCGPCQKELPLLAAAVANEAQLIVVVSQSEDVEDTRRHLTDIGLADHAFYVDVTGKLFGDARVTALPTTFLVTRHGAVLARGTGYSPLAIAQMQRRAASTNRHGADDANDGGDP